MMSKLTFLSFLFNALILLTGCQPLVIPDDASEAAAPAETEPTEAASTEEDSTEVDSAEEGPAFWAQIADMPTDRAMLAGAAVDGKIYTIGGFGGPGLVEMYDPATNTWEARAELPSPRNFLIANVVDGKIYVIGGSPDEQLCGALNVIEEYDPVLDVWTRKADMPTARTLPGTAVYDGKIYVIGGWGGEDDELPIATAEAYDPATDSWSSLPDMPVAHDFPEAIANNDKIYAIGGNSKDYGPLLDRVEVYDPATETWSTAPPLPKKWFWNVVEMDGEVLMLGGMTSEFGTQRTTARYDLETGASEPLSDLPVYYDGSILVPMDDQVYMFGGAVGGGYPFDNQVKDAYVIDIGALAESGEADAGK
jgi:N-acetylneuraminic acid mutarotase